MQTTLFYNNQKMENLDPLTSCYATRQKILLNPHMI